MWASGCSCIWRFHIRWKWLVFSVLGHELLHHLGIQFKWRTKTNDIFACSTPHAVLCNATHYIHVEPNIELNVSFQPESYQTRKSFRSFAINNKHKPNIIYWFYQPFLSNCCLDSFSASFFQRVCLSCLYSLLSILLGVIRCRMFHCIPIKISFVFYLFFLRFSYSFVSLLFFFYLPLNSSKNM